MCHIEKKNHEWSYLRSKKGQEKKKKDGIVPIVQRTKGLSFSYPQARGTLSHM